MSSPDPAAQLATSQAAVRVYQRLLKSAYDNLRSLGREDIVKSIQHSVLDPREAIIAEAANPQPVEDTEDDFT